MPSLAGKKILIVDDEQIIAMMLESMIEELGATPVGPAYDLQTAINLAEDAHADGAILDVNLAGEDSQQVADILAARQIPFILATGYGHATQNDYNVVVLSKPFFVHDVEEALANMFGSTADA